MTAQVPKTTGSWRVHLKVDPAQPDTDSLSWHSKVPLRQLGPTDVCVKLHAASLNFRNLASKQRILNVMFVSVLNDQA
jgi:hypothetical protein